MYTSKLYEQQRVAVIDLFKRYEKSREDLKKCLSQQDSISEDDLVILIKEIESLKANRYLLAVVGESKSGKSAFINGLIKKPLLPTGILQCTSGVIEIVDTTDENSVDKGKVYLKIEYANGQKEEQFSENGDTTIIQEKLFALAALSDEYRSLPIWQLNNYLMEKKPKKITGNDAEIICSEGVDNPYKIPEKDFKLNIERYLKDYQDLSKIATQITMGCPLGFKFTHLRIVDTPGVNARGGLKAATIKYIVDANAAILIHPIKNVASESLENFLTTSVPKQAQSNIFLFLTHKAQSNSEDVDRTIEEAKRLFSNVKPERIIAVDSMLKRIYDDLDDGKTADELRKDEELNKLISPYILDNLSDQTKIPKAVILDSNFQSVEQLIKEFSEQALGQQLESVVNQIAQGYCEQKNIYNREIELRNSKITKKPEEFDLEIKLVTSLLEEYRKILNTFSNSKRKEYTGVNTKIKADFSEMKESYRILLKNSCDSDEVPKHVSDFNFDCDRIVTSYITQLRREYESKMKEVGEDFNNNHSITPPMISLENISIKAKERAYETITIPGNKMKNTVGGAVAGGLYGAVVGFSVGGPIGALAGGAAGAVLAGSESYLSATSSKTESRFNEQKYKDALVSEANTLVSSVSDEMLMAIGNLFTEYDKGFQQRLGNMVKERQDAYEVLKIRKEESDELHEEINFYKAEVFLVSEEIQKIRDINERLHQGE
jgi:hypothetical protein